jgi:transposase
VARDYGLSRRWVHELVHRYQAEGEVGLQPRSRRPRASPHYIPAALEQEIVEFRKQLAEEGLDAGAHTIAVHLQRRHGTCPAPSTIWRVLSRRGFVTPQPQKRPRSSFVRFEADQPNERWQADVTHWSLADGTDVEILNVLDDHSRLLVGSDARAVFKAADVVACFHRAAATWGFPASVLTDNGAVFTARPRGGGRCAIELECDRLGIRMVHSTPYHPQTCGKVERFHQTLKRYLAKKPRVSTLRELAGAAGPLLGLLQRGPAPPGARPSHARRGVRGQAQGEPARPPASRALSRSARPDRPGRRPHASVRQPPSSHQGRGTARRHAGAHAHRRSSPPHRERGRGAAARAHDRSEPHLPADGRKVERCPGTRVNDVPRHHIRAPGGIRTPNLLIRSQMLYPLSYRRGKRHSTSGPVRVLSRRGSRPRDPR